MTTSTEIEVRKHNGQTAYGEWEAYSPSTHNSEIDEAIRSEDGKIEGSSGVVTVGGQKWAWRLAR